MEILGLASMSKGVYLSKDSLGITHQLPGMIKTGQVPECGHGSDRGGELHAAQGLEGLDHRRQSPGMHLLVQGLCEMLEACGGLVHSPDVFLEDDGLCWCGADHYREPAPMGWPSGGLAGRADVMPQQEGFEAQCGCLEIAERLLTRPTQVTHGFVLP
jgi:hypothetical protein